jgi:PAS domain S-box-containing protein
MDAALFARAFEHAHEAFVAVDGGGAITAWNPAAERLYGYTAAEAVGHSLDLLCFPEERADLAALVSSSHRSPSDLILRQRHKSGRELRIALRLAMSDDKRDEKPGYLLCTLDVSWRQRAEDDLAGSQAALAASRSDLRRVARRLVAAEEDERRRVAQELHDDHCQRLAALAFELKAVRKTLPEDDPERSALAAIGGRLAELGEDLRLLSHALHPAILERRGLAEALADCCAEVEGRSGLEVRLSLRGTEGPFPPFPPFPPDIALVLYRIAQEALTNMARHAGARKGHVTLTVDAGVVHLAVADDGRGFEPAEVRRRAGGLGLAAMEERALLLGGTCRIASAPGAGTEIDVFVPLPPPEPAAPEPRAEQAGRHPRHVGPYEILEEIGAGSMATVYLAAEPPPLGRRVALKVHRGPLPGRRETLRFKAEQQALARLHHPAIAQVYEARTTEEGDLYIAMEHAPGMPITEYCDRYSLDLGRRLQLFAAVCDGVRHAHRKGVLHRDLKPSHILVVEEGGKPSPKIIDFGAAKGLDMPLAEGTVWNVEELMGTPGYIAPEALRGDELDTRSDVWALGAVLYELLTGTLPVAAGAEGLVGWIAAAGRGDVPPPSRRLRSLDAGTAAEIARRRGCGQASGLRRRLAGDLDRMALKALAADPADRYPTVDALAKEVGRVLAGEPVEAGPPGALSQLGRLARRHRRLASAAALVIVALAAGLAATAVEARRARQEAVRADAAARFLEDLFRASDPRLASGRVPDTRELLRRGTERLAKQLQDQPILRAHLLDTLGGIHTELGFFDDARGLLQEALTIREQGLGKEHLEVAATLVRLGTLAHLSGQGDAVALFKRALAIREERLGNEHPEVADVLNKLGTTLAAHGRFDEAKATLQRALALDERLWGKADPRVAKVLHNLSGIAFYRGRVPEAEQLLERALAIREKALPEDDPDLAGSREALALLRLKQGRPAEAAALLEKLAATAERIYGPEHPELAKTLLNLGLARQDLGEDAAARNLLERAVAITEKSLAPDHPQHIRALASLADLHFAHGRYAEAEPLYRRLIKLRDQGAAYDAWDKVLANWTRLLRVTGRSAGGGKTAWPTN